MLHKPTCHPKMDDGYTKDIVSPNQKIQLTCLFKGSMLGLKNGYPDCAIFVVSSVPPEHKFEHCHTTANNPFLSHPFDFFITVITSWTIHSMCS